jgi:iron complex outermembrane receptor protein
VRLNDAQSGHHNGDIPVPLDAIERIEILHGVGSSLFGADAFAGTINIITRQNVPAQAAVEAGSFDYAGARGQMVVGGGAVRQLVSASAERSTGFMYERQFSTVDLLTRSTIGARSTITLSYLWKDFGANGFYGAAPSHEWTNQTRVVVEHAFGTWRRWALSGDASYRTHGDHFLFNVERPGVAENFHRSHATIATFKASRAAPSIGSISLGVEAGGDWIRSTNLKDHSTGRVSAFGEWRRTLSDRAQADASARIDQYSEFGTSVSPSAGIGWWARPRVRLRASAGRAFRVPTFTERYYSDPANLARADVGPETAWAGEGGADLFLTGAWTLKTTVFARDDHDVIDWLRASPADLWRTYNVHRVRTAGAEVSVRRALPAGGFVQAGYTGVNLDAATVSTLCGAPACQSKYVLEYAPHVFSTAALVPLPWRVHIAPRLEYKHRRRNALSTDYAVLDLRLSRPVGRYDVIAEMTNFTNTTYQEIAGVAMPGRAATVSLAVGRR